MADPHSIKDPHLFHLFDGEPVLNVYNSEVTNLSAGTPGPDLLKCCIGMFKQATIHRMVSVRTECPRSSALWDIAVIWQTTEKCKEGKFVANRVFAVSCARIFNLGRAVTARLSLYYRWHILRRC
jgi:hypothetical protein